MIKILLRRLYTKKLLDYGLITTPKTTKYATFLKTSDSAKDSRGARKKILVTLSALGVSLGSLIFATRREEDMPYPDDPERHRVLNVQTWRPFNAEPSLDMLSETFVTPNELFYIRNHGPVPNIEANSYQLLLEVEGKEKKFKLNYNDITKRFPHYTVTTTLMCLGIRRSEMMEVPPEGEVNWRSGAIGNATWTGASLKEVLMDAGLTEDDEDLYKHVQFEGYDKDPEGKPYATSIPYRIVMDSRSEVLLAYEMNNKTLLRDHGFPVRLIAPGLPGDRDVKWLSKIYVSKAESRSEYHVRKNKPFAPGITRTTANFKGTPAIMDVPVASAICVPAHGGHARVTDGKILVKGYAFAGGGRRINRVDVTCDGGKTWHVADIECQNVTQIPYHWSWTLWSLKLPVPKNMNEIDIWVKAVDSSYNTQPENVANIKNFQGVLNNAYHKIPVTLVR